MMENKKKVFQNKFVLFLVSVLVGVVVYFLIKDFITEKVNPGKNAVTETGQILSNLIWYIPFSVLGAVLAWKLLKDF